MNLHKLYEISFFQTKFIWTDEIKSVCVFLQIDKDSDPIFGRNPFLLKGEEWKEKRAEITPAFTSLRVSAFQKTQLIVDS